MRGVAEFSAIERFHVVAYILLRAQRKHSDNSERIGSVAGIRGFEAGHYASRLLACTPGICADESGDRAAIESAFRALNAAATRKAVATLFTSDADPVEIERLFRTPSAHIRISLPPG